MTNADQIIAFKTLMKKCVNVDKDFTGNITVLYDEFFQKYFEAFSHLINELRLKVKRSEISIITWGRCRT
jgi:hypothetical protein